MTTTSTHETRIDVDRDVPLLRIVREFDASPSQVFRAHADPELLVQWYGPRGTRTRIEAYDCRTGGTFRFVHISDGYEMAARGCFHEVRPGELIVQTFSIDTMPDGVALEKLVLEAVGDARTRLTRLTRTTLVDSFEGRDAIVASGMDLGVREGYERLDELLAT
jgi:uncharacterized protein YndB with AHSA1/START domain